MNKTIKTSPGAPDEKCSAPADCQRSMVVLPTEFKSDGFNFRQLRRKGDVVLLAKNKTDIAGDSYEVVVIKQQPAKTFPNGCHYAAREAMPRSEDWGVAGWSYSRSELERATKKFDRWVRERTPKRRLGDTPFPASAFSGPARRKETPAKSKALVQETYAN